MPTGSDVVLMIITRIATKFVVASF